MWQWNMRISFGLYSTTQELSTFYSGFRVSVLSHLLLLDFAAGTICSARSQTAPSRTEEVWESSSCTPGLQCACGNPLLWNSITLTCATTSPNILSLMTASVNSLGFKLKTLAQRSGRSCGDCPGKRDLRISGQFGLQVIVKNMSGCPMLFEVAITPSIFWRM